MIDTNKIVLITPDRNDRPEFLEHCKQQMKGQTVQGPLHLVVNYDPVPGVIDLVPRVMEGLDVARKMGYEYAFIIENDDYYPQDYIERMIPLFQAADMIGIDRTIYYSIQYRSYKVLPHPGRSSLFCTGFRIGVLDRFRWPPKSTLYFDIPLWKHQCSKAFASMENMPVGIKHGKGFCPANFHNGVVNGRPMKKMTDDRSLMWLRRNVTEESFSFYKSLMK
jgi:hypothetical protein